MEDNFNQNQTQFSVDEPILEKPVETINDEQPVAKKTLPKYLYFIFAGLIFIIIVLVIAVLNKPTTVVEDEPELIPTPTIAKELTPIEQKIEVAKDKLEESNPTTEKDPFPPINMELRIDEAR
ncbi:MAG: hypothetical protein IT416_04080 [Candidatus Pacebacteria bacterium]|nr:hypothetical protein [Candidatus Paceibacterota bacterium]